MGRWLLSLLRRRKGPVDAITPVQIADQLREYAGLWVALRKDCVIDAAETPDRLLMRLRDRGIQDAKILRAPAENEAVLVGLG